MVKKYYEEFCYWRTRRASLNATIVDEDVNENNISADDYCHLYGNTPFEDKLKRSSLDVDYKPISLLKSDIEVAYRDYISYNSYYQYYEYWLNSDINIAKKSNFIEDFIDTQSYVKYINNNKRIFERKILSIVNWFIYVEGFNNLDWLVDLLKELLFETTSEIKRVEFDLRNFSSNEITCLLNKVHFTNDLNCLEQKTFIEFYFKMSSFDICRKSLPYLNSIVKYVIEVNCDYLKKRTTPRTNNSSIENYSSLFNDEYMLYIDDIDSVLSSLGYVYKNEWIKDKYMASIFYKEMVRLGIMKKIDLAKASMCFKDRFPNISIEYFQEQIKRKKESKLVDIQEAIDTIETDLRLILSKFPNLSLFKQ